MLTFTANHLNFADYVIFLDDEGQIARQGTRESLSDTAEDVQKLAGQPPATTSRPELEIPEDALHELEMLEDPDPADHRHAGDMKIYAYYANTAGWWTISLYLFACAAFVFGVTFPCTLPKPGTEIGSRVDLSSCLVAMVDQCKRGSSK